jgi:glycosyltransferase involved in cell wall biosynthesis
MLKVCFFAKVDSLEILSRVNFYADDIRILKDLGFEVVIATNFKEIPSDCDIYFVWWWTYAFMPLAKAFFRRKPVIITGVFDYDMPPRGHGAAYLDRPVWQKALVQASLRLATKNILLSRFELEQLKRVFGVENMVYSPCAVDINKYVPNDNSIKKDFLCVAWSGRINAVRKCLPQVIDAFAIIHKQHPDIKLNMVGKSGDYHPKLVDQVKRLGLEESIIFCGVVSEEQKVQMMQDCLLYLQPTLFEGFGLAIAEAMACGAAVLTSPEGAIPEVVGQAGALAKGDDPEALAKAILALLRDPEALNVLRVAARQQIASRFTYERRKSEILQVIELCIGKSISPPNPSVA